MAARTTTKAEPTPAGETQPTSEPVTKPDTPAPQPDSTAFRRFGIFGQDVPLSVGEAIAEVTRRVPVIAKEHDTESGERYKYRGIEDVLAALHPILGEVGLVLMPGRITDHRRETRATSKGGTLNVALVTVEYLLIGPDGSETTGSAVGEAHDSGDKATQKAMSQAYKSFALQTFSIPTQSSADDDPDRTNEEARPFAKEELERAGRAYDAALEADSLEKLVGVRRRAAALLNVPVPMVDGSLVPLSVLFEARRAALERPIGDGAA
jgi:hypothetical protein